MASSGPSLKRPSSSVGPHDNKRPKQSYHHHHRLQDPFTLPPTAEPALQDDASIDHLMNRAMGQLLRDSGFDMAHPAALASLRSATEECISLSFHSLCPPIHGIFPTNTTHSSRLRACPEPPPPPHRRPSPISQITITRRTCSSAPPSPPPEDEGIRKFPFLSSLSGEDDRATRSYIPKNFPDFPSKHTYSATPVFTERESDTRKIRERATEDGRHGEEALRKLARAAFRDNQVNSTGNKKLWGRRMESMEGMFEKTVKGMTKKAQKDSLASSNVPGALSMAMDIDSAPVSAEADSKTRSNVSLHLELGPIVNCERDFWRRTTSASVRRAEDKDTQPTASIEPFETVGGA
ncbi:transcriptional regulator family: Bromodomain transcription factor [Penicillium lagena]|uniref:transcriptional regulator family: Bromodomain transcription factor n=1 Tax=Penicillium lagena TaxID=94218 RepID=UPI00253FBE46|nr:transcriptional regulator family: Bromodomain transcription factor [Penicillium lagena]KAJ5626263.1 transcriptional regulator family: Bromodomain transcription factor [Penicillium lagena]